MDISEIRDLIQLIEKSAVEEFEMERSGVRVRIRKQMGAVHTGLSAASPTGTLSSQPPPEPVEEGTVDESLYTFKSPIVGTYFSSPKPDADPFVSKGDEVHKGMVLCIVEAMKLFNQIESDVEGEIVRILVENAQPVEYGEPLFEIRLGS